MSTEADKPECEVCRVAPSVRDISVLIHFERMTGWQQNMLARPISQALAVRHLNGEMKEGVARRGDQLIIQAYRCRSGYSASRGANGAIRTL